MNGNSLKAHGLQPVGFVEVSSKNGLAEHR